MSDNFWKKISVFVGFVATGLLFALIVFTTNVEVKDLDLWLHIAAGRHMVDNFHTNGLWNMVPGVDFLSHSIAGKPWVNHEWLFQIIVYNVFNWWGTDGLIQMQSILVLITFVMLFFLSYSKDRQIFTVFFMLLVLLVYQTRFTIRPDIFSIFFMVFYVFFLSNRLDRRSSIYWLTFAQIIWSNMHGFFFLGPLIIGLCLLSECLKRNVKLPFEWGTANRLPDDEYRNLK